MNIFDIIGPVMVGPSSSHTAGVVRIGNVCYNIFGYTPKDITITFYGSFAKTYKGHGSDKAIVAGLLNFKPDDTRIITSLQYAKEQGYNIKFLCSESHTRHANTIKIEGIGIDDNPISILAESVGGANILIRRINDTDLEIDGTYDTLVAGHLDKPGVIKDVSQILYDNNINIATMKVFRSIKGTDAMMIIEVDDAINDNIIKLIKECIHINTIRFVPKISN